MISFLEFVCETCMGPPRYGRSWCCPFHDDSTPSFAVNPPKQRPDGGWYDIKFRCHGCGQVGDEWDILKHFFPQATYQQLLKRYRAWQVQYESLTGTKVDFKQRPFFPPGTRGDDADLLKFCCAELRSVIRDRDFEWKEEEAGFKVLLWADAIASEQGVTLDAFARQAVSELIAARTGAKK